MSDSIAALPISLIARSQVRQRALLLLTQPAAIRPQVVCRYPSHPRIPAILRLRWASSSTRHCSRGNPTVCQALEDLITRVGTVALCSQGCKCERRGCVVAEVKTTHQANSTLPASSRRRKSERNRPSISSSAAGSALSLAMRTRLSSRGFAIFFSDKHQIFAFKHPHQEGVLRRSSSIELRYRIERRADLAPEAQFHRGKCGIEFFQHHAVRGDEDDHSDYAN